MSLACDVRSTFWEGAVRFGSSNLSPEGMWLDTPLAVEPGEELLVTFSPPGQFLRLHALCEVRRVGLWRRARDPWPAGMGVVFTDLRWADRDRLARALIGIPPPLPRPKVLREIPRSSAVDAQVRSTCPGEELPPVLDPWLASTCEAPWQALSGLMTGGVPRAQGSSLAVLPSRKAAVQGDVPKEGL